MGRLFLLCAWALIAGCATSAPHKAALEGNTEEVLRLPKGRWESCLLCRSGLRTTVLGCAVAEGHFDTVRALLREGAKTSAACPYNPLNLAVGKPDMLKLLLESGGDPSSFDGMECPLHAAVSWRNLDSLRLLLAAGADLSCKDGCIGSRQTPLEWAEGTVFLHKRPWPEGVKLLRDAADPAARARMQAQARYEKDKAAIEASEKAGDEAAKGGRAAQALKRFVEAYRACPDGQPAKKRLLDKIFGVVGQMSPPPLIPAEAQQHADRAESFLRLAADAKGFVKGARELELALEAAPWWSEAYYNLGLTKEKAGDLSGAARALGLFLRARPGAPEADAVRKKVTDLEVGLELKRD